MWGTIAVIQNSVIEFYDDIYTHNPRKWASIDRDYLAFKILNQEMQEPTRMLDFGCGNGHTIAFFKSQWPGTKYSGVDISDVALELARERIPHGLFVKDIARTWGCWNVITIMGVAEHFPDVAVELCAITERLCPDGYLYLEVPNCLAYSDDKTEGFRQTQAGSGQMEWHWQRKTWEAAIKAAGFQIVKRYRGIDQAWEYIWVLRKLNSVDRDDQAALLGQAVPATF